MFTRWRTMKGRRYLYGELRWRENGKVKSKSWIIQPRELGHGGYLEQMAQYPSPSSPSNAASGHSQPSTQSPGGASSTEPSSEQGAPSDRD